MAWKEFRRGKRSKTDVREFEFSLEENLFNLHYDLKQKIYNHGLYQSFYIQDPKRRHINKATVRDRVLHHAVFRIFYPIFDKLFIYDSYSCRKDKGTHAAVNRLDSFLDRSSCNNSKKVFVLKCDIRKFFDSVNHQTLLKFIKNKVTDKNLIWLVEKIIFRFEFKKGQGIPLGNVTSQLFANIYLNELDQFIKHKLKVRHYIRYCDDFIIISKNDNYLQQLISVINLFLRDYLALTLHERKIIIRPYRQGIDFLGYVLLPHYRVLRTKTKRRILKLIKKNLINEKSLPSYLGHLQHCRSFKLRKLLYSNSR